MKSGCCSFSRSIIFKVNYYCRVSFWCKKPTPNFKAIPQIRFVFDLSRSAIVLFQIYCDSLQRQGLEIISRYSTAKCEFHGNCSISAVIVQTKNSSSRSNRHACAKTNTPLNFYPSVRVSVVCSYICLLRLRHKNRPAGLPAFHKPYFVQPTRVNGIRRYEVPVAGGRVLCRRPFDLVL